MKNTLRASGIAMLTAGAVLLATPNVAVAAGQPAADDSASARAGEALSSLAESVEALQAHPISEAESVEAAMTSAKVQDRQVEVLQMRTETDTVYANPDGTLTRQTAAGPVRMIQDGRWVDVDVDLRRESDGDVVAKAHPEGLRLAGKGVPCRAR